MALSRLEMKDCRPSSPGSESQLLPPGEKPDQRWSPDCRKQNSSQQVRPGVFSPKPTLDSQLHVTSQAVSRHPDSISKQSAVQESNQIMDNGDFNQAEEPKQPKKKRQRRKGAPRQIVGLPCSPSAAPPVLLWFRRDLRLCDNPALIGSLEVGAPVIPVFIWSPEEEEGPGITVAMGGACK